MDPGSGPASRRTNSFEGIEGAGVHVSRPHEGFGADNPVAQSVTVVFLHRPAAVFVAGQPSTSPRYRIVPTVPEGQYTDASRKALVKDVTDAVVRADGGKHEDVAPRVWVFPTEIPEGQCGSRGVINPLPDIQARIAGEHERKVGVERLRLQAHYAAIPGEFINWAPLSWDGISSEHFTRIEPVCHVRDIEIDGYQVRLHRIVHEASPNLVSIDSVSLAIERSYATSSAKEALAAFRAARAKAVKLISGLTAGQFSRTAVFDGYGTVSLRSLVHYLSLPMQPRPAALGRPAMAPAQDRGHSNPSRYRLV
jgi:phenylpyruvate tautomerase PptA (4-oxalocrotonate tautomerase family)